MTISQQLALPEIVQYPGFARLLSGDNQMLIFRLAQVYFGIEALSIREMHFLPELAPLEEAPPAVAGLLNLRGELIPVLDLEYIFGRTRRHRQLSQGIIVLEIGSHTFAIIVDEVQSVITASPEDLREVPRFGSGLAGNACVSGLLQWEERVAMLLDLRQVWEAAQFHSEGQTAWETSLSSWETDASLASPSSGTDFDTAQEEFRNRARHLMQAADETGTTSGLFAVALVEIGGEIFSVSLKDMREFTELRLVSPVPCCPDYILGQMNLRGDVVTLVDIRPLLNLPPRPIKQGGQVMVVTYQDSPVGILLDAVLDVVYLPAESILSPAAAGTTSGRYFSGGALHSGKMICLLDLGKLLAEGLDPIDESL